MEKNGVLGIDVELCEIDRIEAHAMGLDNLVGKPVFDKPGKGILQTRLGKVLRATHNDDGTVQIFYV